MTMMKRATRRVLSYWACLNCGTGHEDGPDGSTSCSRCGRRG